jgi:hypothetical protein
MRAMGYEFRLRVPGPWPPPGCHAFLLRCGGRALRVSVVKPSGGGYSRTTYEYRSPSDREGMPLAWLQVEHDGFYLCENAGWTALLDQLVRYGLLSGPVTVGEP